MLTLSWSLDKLRVFPSVIKKQFLLSACQIHLAGGSNAVLFPSENHDQKKEESNSATRNHLKRFSLSSWSQGECDCQCLISNSKKSLEPIENFEEVCREWDQPRVVIVGAGLAGLAAANRLSQSGIDNYIILEASDRPGGRVMTAWLGDIVVEVGAEWIHGGSVANPAYILACLEQLLPVQCPDICDPSAFRDNKPYYLTSNAKTITQSSTEEMVFAEIVRGAGKVCDSYQGSLAQYLSLKINQELKNFPKEKQSAAEIVLNGLMSSLQTGIGADLDEVSVEQLNPNKKLPGGEIRVPQGMAGILSPLIKTLPSVETIRYNCPVIKIKWGDGDPRAKVITCDDQEHPADYVIIAIPLGVLKESPNLFYPSLPDEKMSAIQKIGFGRLEHVYAEYARPWWACPQPLRIARSKFEMANKEDWTDGITTIEPKIGSTHIVSTSIAGTEADLLDEVVEESIAIDLTKTIRKFTGDPSIPYPINILRSKWGSNQYFNGSRSFMSVETRKGHFKTLAETIPEPCLMMNTGDPRDAPLLFFAGEATSVDFYGTMHGALLSGTKQAQKIIDLTKQFKGLPILEAKPQFKQCMSVK